MLMNKNPTRVVHSLGFKTYTDQEILDLSVVEVKSSKTFDVLGHSIPGSVYDRALGCIGYKEICGTCGGEYTTCPGHIGHISLALPVFDPVFAPTLYTLLRGCCLMCHRTLSQTPKCLLLQAQMKVLDYGKLDVVQEMANEVSDLLKKNLEHYVDELKERLSEMVNMAIKDAGEEKLDKLQLRNIVEYKQRLLKEFTNTVFLGQRKNCSHCQRGTKKIYRQPNNTFVLMPENADKARIKIKKKAKEKKKNLEKRVEEVLIAEEEEEDENELNILFQEQTILTPMDVQNHLNEIWENESSILKCLFPILKSISHPNDIFLRLVIPVPPPKFRPVNRVGDQKFENPQSLNLTRVIQANVVICHLLNQIKTGEENPIDNEAERAINKLRGNSLSEKLRSAWTLLQTYVNSIHNNDVNSKVGDKSVIGVKQIIEKKEGLFRQNMMGKRVNYSARSVISPDPFISVEEIGVPEVFAKKLTYPQPVTPWNVNDLRQAVINGPDVHPGATMVENADGQRIWLGSSELKRQAIAKQLLTPGIGGELQGCKKVFRHLIDGDMLLVNRQPTLHKPSIMAHKARVLRGERTLRLHYSNCKTYNADFDGDEMNIHLPQSELARAEARMIANVTNQYLVPKDGTPLGGLIQDHMISGVLMTKRGQFFERAVYMQLVLSAIPNFSGPIKIIPPAIFKPCPMWSGKQIFSTILINLTPVGKPSITLEGVAKIAVKSWQNSPPREWSVGGKIVDPDMSENEVIIRGGELLCGVLDKAHYGPTPFGLVHCFYELYGGVVSSELLSALGRLFTSFMQITGFSLGSLDIVSDSKADHKRSKLISKAQKVGNEVAAEALSIKDPNDLEMIRDQLEAAHFDTNGESMKALDMEMKAKTDELSNQISKVVMPNGLLKKFPENNLQLMVLSGAKGATVNSMQISCSLGQIELEGRRPPLMPSGRSLPSFGPYDVTPRAGGYVAGRFATGIEVQEFFFHCMAGREGLIDTAVKTSRSGYLQRCLIKHLEGLHVNYDMTVRDSDGSVIQYLYGEDGLDIQKSAFLQTEQIPFLINNNGAFYNEKKINQLKTFCDDNEVSSIKKSIKKWKKKHRNNLENIKMVNKKTPFQLFSSVHSGNNKDELIEMWKNLDEDEKHKFIKKCTKCPDPIVSKLNPDRNFGALVERLDDLIEDYLSVNPNNLIDDSSNITSDKFKNMMNLKVMHSMCEPGEAVGLLAAQSVGEPSTQMTLNTFHFAGRGDMNVTLGIPRMREILMAGGKNIATPSMEIPFLPSAVDQAEETRLLMDRVNLYQLIQQLTVNDRLNIKDTKRYREYKLHFKFLPYKHYKQLYHTNPAQVLRCVEESFIKKLIKLLKITENSILLSKSIESSNGRRNKNNAENETELSEEEKNEDDDSEDEEDVETAAARLKNQHGEGTYEEKDDDDNVVKDDDEDDESESTCNTDAEEDEDNVEKMETEGNVEYMGKLTRDDKRKRINAIKSRCASLVAYDFDAKKEEWCELTFRFKLTDSPVDMSSLVQTVSKSCIVYEIPNVRRAVLREVKGETFIKTDGVNIQKMFQFNQTFDLNRLYCNNIHSIAEAYGIEAARRVIVKEIQDVFSVYGIQVDPRHLLLIADYMTFDGTYTALNRAAMGNNTSPLQQMSFETTMQFLKTAALQANKDTLKSPSAQLVVGNIVGMGTGKCDLIQVLC